MAEKKNLCAPIAAELHQKVREEQERLGQTLGQYVEQVLRIKAYLAAHPGLSQKEFIVGLVEEALAQWEQSQETTGDTAEPEGENAEN